MSDLVEFLRARLTEDEAAAKLIQDIYGTFANRWLLDDTSNVVAMDGGEIARTPLATYSEHIARWDPARALHEVEKTRQLLDEFGWLWRQQEQDETDAELHARSAHPDYEYETTTGGRKTWDYADVPPSDADGEPDHTWERNTDAGIPGEGWERFDYTEESYWRRRRPAEEIERRRLERDRPPKFLRILAEPYADHREFQEAWRV